MCRSGCGGRGAGAGANGAGGGGARGEPHERQRALESLALCLHTPHPGRAPHHRPGQSRRAQPRRPRRVALYRGQASHGVLDLVDRAGEDNKKE
eukprot:6001757-Pyramimonas_sp.AAC.1